MKLKTEKINVKIKKNITIAQKYDKYQKHKKLLKILVGGRGLGKPLATRSTRSDSKLRTIPDPDPLLLLPVQSPRWALVSSALPNLI